MEGDLNGDLKGDLKGDFEVDLKVDLEGDFRVDFKQYFRTWKGTCCKAQVRFSIELKFNSFDHDSEVGRLVFLSICQRTSP